MFTTVQRLRRGERRYSDAQFGFSEFGFSWTQPGTEGCPASSPQTLTWDGTSGGSHPARWGWGAFRGGLNLLDGGVQGWCSGSKQESLECSCNLYLLISSQWNSKMPTGPHGELSRGWKKGIPSGAFLLICTGGTFITWNNSYRTSSHLMNFGGWDLLKLI